jgi:hypothetical protein
VRFGGLVSGRRDVYAAVPGLASLAAEQSAIVHRDQLTRLGVTPEAVQCHIDALRWRPLGPLVVALNLGDLSTSARRWAVVLGCGPEAALGAWTSLAEWGLSGWDRGSTHVVVRRGSTPPRLPDAVGPVTVHESRRHTADDVHTRGGLRMHSVDRAAVDAAAWSAGDRSACGLLAAVVQQRLTTADRLLAELDLAGKVRRRGLMRLTLGDVAGGSQALSEIDFVRFCRRRGLPLPARQVVRRDLTGRRRYLDVEWRLRDGRTFAVEIDGVGHLDSSRWYDDLLRTAELLAGGSSEPMRLPALAVRVEPDRVERILRALLLIPRQLVRLS